MVAATCQFAPRHAIEHFFWIPDGSSAARKLTPTASFGPGLTQTGLLLYKRRTMLNATLMTAMAMCMYMMCMPAAVGALEGSQG